MGRSARVLGLLRPYRFLFAANIAATLVASLMDGATFVLLIPFLRALFKLQALPSTGSSAVEQVLGRVAGPLLTVGAPEVALRNVVLVLLVALVIKNAAAYAAAIDRKSTRLNSSHVRISYAVFCLQKIIMYGRGLSRDAPGTPCRH